MCFANGLFGDFGDFHLDQCRLLCSTVFPHAGLLHVVQFLLYLVYFLYHALTTVSVLFTAAGISQTRFEFLLLLLCGTTSSPLCFSTVMCSWLSQEACPPLSLLLHSYSSHIFIQSPMSHVLCKSVCVNSGWGGIFSPLEPECLWLPHSP